MKLNIENNRVSRTKNLLEICEICPLELDGELKEFDEIVFVRNIERISLRGWRLREWVEKMSLQFAFWLNYNDSLSVLNAHTTWLILIGKEIKHV